MIVNFCHRSSTGRGGGGGGKKHTTIIKFIFIFLIVGSLLTAALFMIDYDNNNNTKKYDKYYLEKSFILPSSIDTSTTTTTSYYPFSGTTNTTTKTKTKTITTTNNNQEDSNKQRNKKITIAYAVSITKLKDNIMYDNAAVLHESIQIAHASESTKYDYKMIAFVHPNAVVCKEKLIKLGYEVLIRDIPFNSSQIQNLDLIKVQKNGCCGIDEYLKLYSWSLLDYPIVVHLDLDTIVLKPLDKLFDLMLEGPSSLLSSLSLSSRVAQVNTTTNTNTNTNTNTTRTNNNPAMWIKDTKDFPKQIDFMFTRDYNMVDPPKRQPHEIGVQGGFLMIRPNITDFEKLIQIILSGGGWISGVGWGGQQKKRYGGYYGAGTIQGLASYYVGEFAQNRYLEMNRCYVNTMVDDPMNTQIVNDRPKMKLQCRTLQDECEDCRKTKLEEIYTAHFTVCGKPQFCTLPFDWWQGKGMNDHHDLCMKLFQRWHMIRRSMEDKWSKIYYPNYKPTYYVPNDDKSERDIFRMNYTLGHCRKGGDRKHPNKYIEMTFPSIFTDPTSTEVLI